MKWEPIETAPKGSGENGPESVMHPDYIRPPSLLLFTDEGCTVGNYDWYYHPGYGAASGERDTAWCDTQGYSIYPTHWMLLPEPPEERGAE